MFQQVGNTRPAKLSAAPGYGDLGHCATPSSGAGMTVLRDRTQSCRTISIAPSRGIYPLPVPEACRVEYLGEKEHTESQ